MLGCLRLLWAHARGRPGVAPPPPEQITNRRSHNTVVKHRPGVHQMLPTRLQAFDELGTFRAYSSSEISQSARNSCSSRCASAAPVAGGKGVGGNQPLGWSRPGGAHL